MSTLVIKTNETAQTGAKKLYRDALVSEGTLLVQDYSNTGTLDNFSLADDAIVKDLAREYSEDELDINNQAIFKYNSDLYSKSLTTGKGVLMNSNGVKLNGEVAQYGFDLGKNLLQHIADNPTNEFLAIYWVRKNAEITTTDDEAFVTSIDGSGRNIVRLKLNNGKDLIPTLCNATGIQEEISQVNVTQVAIVYKGVGNLPDSYKNGVFTGQGTTVALSIGTPSTDLIIGNQNTSFDINAVIYRVLIEDLTLSGRTALDVVKKDFDYCTQTGEYINSPTKRPFIDSL